MTEYPWNSGAEVAGWRQTEALTLYSLRGCSLPVQAESLCVWRVPHFISGGEGRRLAELPPTPNKRGLPVPRLWAPKECRLSLGLECLLLSSKLGALGLSVTFPVKCAWR